MHHVEEGHLVHETHQVRVADMHGTAKRFDLPEAREVLLARVMAERLISEIGVDKPADVPLPRTFTSDKSYTGVSAKDLSERWYIGLAQAIETIKATTQNCIRSAILPLSCRYRADRILEKPLLRGDFYMDSMDGRCKSLNDNQYAQVMANKDFFAVAYPMTNKLGAGDALHQFINAYGRPKKLTFDGSQEQCGRKTKFMKNIRKYCISHHVPKPYRPNHNFVEGVIR